VSFVISAEYINLIVISNMLWPREPFHALQLGAMITIRLWIDGLMALFWGYLVDRYNRKKIFSINCGMTGILVMINGFLPIGGGNQNYIFWVIIRACIGVFMSGGGPNTQSLSSDLLSKAERSQFFGLVSIVWAVVQVCAMIISAFMFQYGYWRVYFYIASSIYLVLAAYLIFYFQEPKRGIQEQALAEVLANDEIKYHYKLNKETVRDTLFSKTNLLVFAEGIFSNVFFGVLDLVLLPYIQSPPRNISPGNTSIFMLIFGIPGALIGSIILARLSDNWGKKNIKNRITLIIISLASAYLIVMGLFLIPLPALTPDQGSQFSIIFEFPIFFWLGLIIFFSRLSFGVFTINQPAVILEINLPEAQGTVRSWGQLVEIASYGSGPLIAGFMLTYFDQDYFGVVFRVFLLTLPGILMWMITYKTIYKDQARIQTILKTRAEELTLKHLKE
jgi:MFS family permease